MPKYISFICLLFLLECNAYSQDTIKNALKLTEKIMPKTSLSDIFEIDNGCQEYAELENKNFRTNSVLKDLYLGINNSHSFNLDNRDTFLYIKELLLNGRDKSQPACFLPFLRLFDKTADDVYGYTCFTSSYHIPHKVYCREPNIQFLILFTIQFSFIEKFNLPPKMRFEEIELRKKNDTTERHTLTQNDYNIIYDYYSKWLTNRFAINNYREINPLKNSEYEWVIKTGPCLTKKQLKRYKEWLRL